MHISYIRAGHTWTDAPGLWQALGLPERSLPSHGPYITALTGAGGKTSLIRRLAFEGRERGLRILVLTTTHMFRPSAFGVLDAPAAAVAECLDQNHLAVAGHLEENGKISFQGWDYYHQLLPLADVVLIEADGSKRLPVKVPQGNEPVLPGHTDLLLCLTGLSALGRPAEEACFRLERARELRRCYTTEGDMKEPWCLGTEDLGGLLKWGYLKPLGARFPDSRLVPVLTQADTKEEAVGRGILEALGEQEGILCGGLKEEPSFTLF